ncbi:glutamate 5-kinase [Betaproteobacteria bacterium]|nr:glutamate 5-kinase [Betaproteobacteria bacterium]
MRSNSKFSIDSTELKQGARLVVKIGTAVLTNNKNAVCDRMINTLASQISTLQKEGFKIIIVSSGAIAAGVHRMGWKQKPKKISHLQAAAAVGQVSLVETYEKEFKKNGLTTAQVLITGEDFSSRKRYLNSKATFETLLNENILVIVNENDTVSTDEIKVGDNDTLAASIATAIQADLFVILTDQKGLFTENPTSSSKAELIQSVDVDDKTLSQVASKSHSEFGTGGMETKINAARIVARLGIDTIIASGFEIDILLKIKSRTFVGTTILSGKKNKAISARKQWMLNHIKAKGKLYLDSGAISALVQYNKSLLPVGIVKIDGRFDRGDLVVCLTETGVEVARGLINYSSFEANKISGLLSEQIEKKLGYMEEPEVIHKDNLILISSSFEESKTMGASSSKAEQ